jgi:hypothetical protein
MSHGLGKESSRCIKGNIKYCNQTPLLYSNKLKRYSVVGSNEIIPWGSHPQEKTQNKCSHTK